MKSQADTVWLEAERPPASPRKKTPIERTGSPLNQPSSPSEDPKTLLLHDLNDKLLKQVKALRSDKEDLAKKVAQLEEQLNAVSDTSTWLFNQLLRQISFH